MDESTKVSRKVSRITFENIDNQDKYTIIAERIGFEPTKPFRGLHAFQACLFNHSSTFPC